MTPSGIAEDWRGIANANECNEDTVKRWVFEILDSFKQPYGDIKLSDHIFQPCPRELLMSILEENSQAALKYLSVTG